VGLDREPIVSIDGCQRMLKKAASLPAIRAQVGISAADKGLNQGFVTAALTLSTFQAGPGAGW
jgi:hypothetical protein